MSRRRPPSLAHHVAPMVLDDLDEVLEIERKSFAAPWTPDLFVAEFDNPRSHRYVVRKGEGGILLGYILFWMVIDECHLMNVAVNSDHRREGAAHALVDKMIAVARQEGAIRITLEVRRSNIAALKLYDNYGFITIGLRKKYYVTENEDAVVMELRL